MNFFFLAANGGFFGYQMGGLSLTTVDFMAQLYPDLVIVFFAEKQYIFSATNTEDVREMKDHVLYLEGFVCLCCVCVCRLFFPNFQCR